MPHYHFRFYVSDMQDNLYQDAKIAYGQAYKAYQYRFYDLGSYILYQDICEKFDFRWNYQPQEEEAVMEALKNNDALGAYKILTKQIKENMSKGLLESVILKRNVMFLAFRIVHGFEMMLSTDFKKNTDEYMTRIYGAGTMEELQKFLFQFLMELGKDMNFQKELTGVDVLKHCKEYVNGHYMEEINLESMAEKYYFNPSYFSTLFRNEYGVNFSEYLIRTRMINAKEFLISNKYKIKEIAAMVGYRDANYFIRAYKKYYGYTPDEYRKILSQR